ncbi:MAG TPA: hypothetical protein VFR35_18010 [Actinoplanes sp.]|nr:hypothetical protein [Actinoplanes sp.]
MSLFRASSAATGSSDGRPAWSVPNPRPAYADLDDGPTERLYESEPEPAADRPGRARRGGVTVAVVIALLALVASAGASTIAWRALAVAGSSRAPAPAGTAPATFAPPDPGPSAEAAPSAEATPSAEPTPPVEPSAAATDAGYAASYLGEPLKVQVGCASAMYLDLDQPQAGADPQQADLRYDSRCRNDHATLTLATGAEAGSQVPSPDTGAAGCDKAIKTSPLEPGAGVPVHKGAVLCVLTSVIDAEDRGERPRVVLVEVTDLGTDGTASMRASSWTVPE